MLRGYDAIQVVVWATARRPPHDARRAASLCGDAIGPGLADNPGQARALSGWRSATQRDEAQRPAPCGGVELFPLVRASKCARCLFLLPGLCSPFGRSASPPQGLRFGFLCSVCPQGPGPPRASGLMFLGVPGLRVLVPNRRPPPWPHVGAVDRRPGRRASYQWPGRGALSGRSPICLSPVCLRRASRGTRITPPHN